VVKKLWNRDFILLLQGNTVSTIGDLMYSVAIGYWVYAQTGSSTLMGVMSAISMFVSMFCSPFSGSIVDKCKRKWVLVGMDLMQSVIMLTVGVLAYMNKLNVAGVLIAAFLAALGSVFYSPAVSTLMIDIIPKDDMVRGQSIFSSVNALISMVGSAFSGVLVAFFGVPLIVVLNGLSNLYSAITELFLRVPQTVQEGQAVTVKSVLHDTKAAVKAIFAEPCLKIFVPSAFILNLLSAGPLSLALPFTAEKGFSVEQYGYLMAVWTAASLICAVLLGTVKFNPKARFWIMGLVFSCSCVMMILAYLSNGFLSMSILLFVGVFLNSAGDAIFNASLMLALPEENRCAILGFITSACVGGTAISSVIYGILGDIFPMYIIFVIGSAISLAPMLYLCFHPRTKEFVLSH
jgi:MFS family permease